MYAILIHVDGHIEVDQIDGNAISELGELGSAATRPLLPPVTREAVDDPQRFTLADGREIDARPVVTRRYAGVGTATIPLRGMLNTPAPVTVAVYREVPRDNAGGGLDVVRCALLDGGVDQAGGVAGRIVRALRDAGYQL